LNDKYYLWGLGGIGRRALEYLLPMGVLCGIIDNDPVKRGRHECGLEVVGYDKALPDLRNKGVIVAFFDSQEAERQLKRDGVHYYHLNDFIIKWHLESGGKRAIGFLDFPITTRCTLNCVACMQYIPYRKKLDVPIELLIQELNELFTYITFVGEISIIGGEPFLHPDLAELLTHIDSFHRDKIGSLVITTNAMVLPDERTLRACRDTGIFVSISDYSENVFGIVAKLADFEKTIKEAGLNVERKRWSWCDPGKFEHENAGGDCGLHHMQFSGGKLWSCTLMAAACAAGYCEPVAGWDYIDAWDCTYNQNQWRTSCCNRCMYKLKQAIPASIQLEQGGR